MLELDGRYTRLSAIAAPAIERCRPGVISVASKAS
ncbi:hypothetical protein C7451_102277 [Blastomonas natatoria]|uniref:Uncharacterized protein n=1 Tax=Blastomonas natatoria TaxID=34015 RepID=A0A2V3VEW3_9SPHN|nr:hypothetical protein C7451_102277 [Blastomonas natatoria]